MKQETNAKKIWQKPELTDLDVNKAKSGPAPGTNEDLTYFS